MKDSLDNLTPDLLKTKRARGRPRTGSAKTGTERQRAYRRRSRGNDRASLSVVISAEAKISLVALARHRNCSLAEVLEPLLIAEKDKIMQEIYATGSLEEQDAASKRFFGLE
ncbi:TPA: hypothetical protein SIA39_004123 [Aeromonas sobria]|nr:hypothetical protein [Aeromonas sobria]